VSELPVDILVERARHGDRLAFEDLFHSTHAKVFNFLRSLGLSYDEAADQTQEVYVRAWSRLDRLRSSESFVAWLHQIARNAAKDYYKHRSRHPETAMESVEDRGVDWEETPEGAAEARAISQSLRQGLAALPEAQRLPIVMHHLEGLPVADISRALGVSFGTVLSRLARGRAALARRLAPLMEETDTAGKKYDVLQD